MRGSHHVTPLVLVARDGWTWYRCLTCWRWVRPQVKRGSHYWRHYVRQFRPVTR